MSTGITASCPPPFIAEASITDGGGYIGGRWCKEIATISCCFPCPIADWRYSDDFTLEMVPWIGVFGIVLLVIALLSFAVLPTSTTSRHYLTTSPIIGFTFMAVAFVIPSSPNISECRNEITPNDWLSENYCALSGSLLIYGVWVVVISCFFRSLFLYIHLCWEIELGPKFRYACLSITFLGAAALLVLVLLLSGLSYHVGKLCQINFHRSKESLWGPLLAVTSLSLVLQLLIMAHCIFHVVQQQPPRSAVRSWIWRGHRQSAESGGLPPPGFSRTLTKAQALRRIVRILQMQWRAVVIAALIVFHAALMAHALLSAGDATTYSLDEVMPWVVCLLDAEGDKDQCLHIASRFGPGKELTMAAWTLLSLSGFWAFVCIMRISMAVAWVEYVKEKWQAWTCVSHRRSRSAQDRSGSNIAGPMAEEYNPLGSVAHASWQEDKKKLDVPQTMHISESYSASWPLRD
ncbi:hypothetical protein BJY01DRAFT_255023 [Aspergillus pseudoustus]|uniref:G-protein coupled receptors family 2 profile 2 domain-containing protein n=1 Tax=Aspergillus pseudoustus TaxID=1810923 RepID=A0ABR4INP9_9EURO